MKEVDQWIDQFRKNWEAKFSELDNVLLTLKNRELN
jgi:hypothetical protein